MLYFEFINDLHFTWSWLLSELPVLMGGRSQLMTADVTTICNLVYGCIVAGTLTVWCSIPGGSVVHMGSFFYRYLVYQKSSIRKHNLSPFGKCWCLHMAK